MLQNEFLRPKLERVPSKIKLSAFARRLKGLWMFMPIGTAVLDADLIPYLLSGLVAAIRRPISSQSGFEVPLSPHIRDRTRPTLNTMRSIPLSDSTGLPWLVGIILGVVFLYYYSTKTDIAKIRGIPEIPGALPMCHLRHRS
jgi:hypothetical protein